MKSIIIIEIDTDEDKDEVNISVDRFEASDSSDRHKEVIGFTYDRLCKLFDEATSI